MWSKIRLLRFNVEPIWTTSDSRPENVLMLQPLYPAAVYTHMVHPEFKCLYRNHNPNCAFPAWTHMKSKREMKHWNIIIPKCFCMWRPCRLTHTQNYINNSSRINNPTHTVTISFKIYTYRYLSYICFVSWSVAVTLTAWLSVEVVIQQLPLLFIKPLMK